MQPSLVRGHLDSRCVHSAIGRWTVLSPPKVLLSDTGAEFVHVPADCLSHPVTRGERCIGVIHVNTGRRVGGQVHAGGSPGIPAPQAHCPPPALRASFSLHPNQEGAPGIPSPEPRPTPREGAQPNPCPLSSLPALQGYTWEHAAQTQPGESHSAHHGILRARGLRWPQSHLCC